MLRYWVSLASLAVLVAFTLADGSPSRLLQRTCRAYPVSKTFTMTRYTTNDTGIARNGTCTFAVPSFQCAGLCETYAQTSTRGATKTDDIYTLKFEEKCRCCEALKSGTQEIKVGPNTFECQEDGEKWDKEVVYESVLSCACRTCRGSAILPPQNID